jgi:hypothetical protein
MEWNVRILDKIMFCVLGKHSVLGMWYLYIRTQQNIIGRVGPKCHNWNSGLLYNNLYNTTGSQICSVASRCLLPIFLLLNLLSYVLIHLDRLYNVPTKFQNFSNTASLETFNHTFFYKIIHISSLKPHILFCQLLLYYICSHSIKRLNEALTSGTQAYRSLLYNSHLPINHCSQPSLLK